MSREHSDISNLSCPLPLDDHATVQLAHGGGGRLMRGLIEGLFLPAFAGGRRRGPPHDSAVVEIGGAGWPSPPTPSWCGRCSFPAATSAVWRSSARSTTWPWPAPGRCASARASSWKKACPWKRSAAWWRRCGGRRREAGVEIVTGDTKVVDRGKGDGIFINTAGIGLVPPGIDISPRRVAAGDVVLLSGDLGRHGMAVMSVREGLGFEAALESDCASLAGLVEAMLPAAAICTASATSPAAAWPRPLNEIALDAGVGIELDEAAIPVSEPVAGACELLGLDPLYVANEGRLIALAPAAAAAGLLQIMRSHPAAPQAGAGRPGHGRASRHRRLAQPPGGQPHRRSAFRRADAADLLTGRTRSIRHTLGGPDSLAIGVPQAQEAVAAYGGSSCGFAVCDCQAEGVREFRRDDTNENQASGVEDTTPRRQAAKAQRYERERGRRSKLAVGRRFANYLFFLCGLAAWRLCVRDFSP